MTRRSSCSPPSTIKVIEGFRPAFVRTLHEAGVHLLMGTDTPNPFVVPGFAVHDELRHFAEAGLTASATLAASAREAAAFLGGLDTWGTVQQGKRVDLLLLDANPLDSPANVQTLAGVMVRGRWLPRDELARMLAALRQPKGSDTKKSAFAPDAPSVSTIGEVAASFNRCPGVRGKTALGGEWRSMLPSWPAN